MKKVLLIILALVLSFALCACGSDETNKTEAPGSASQQNNQTDAAVSEVIAMIRALSDVSLTSGKTITNAEAAYNALTDAQKSAVTNYADLMEAREYYDRIFNVYSLIELIGPVTKDSEAAIIAAETAYQALPIEERIAIVNVATLTAARATFDAIPTEIALTLENVGEYFTLEHSSSTSKKDIGGYYGRKITGSVTAKQSVTMESLSNVTITVRVTCSVGRPVDGSYNAETEYKEYYYDVTIAISATSGAGSGYFETDGHYTSKYYYPTIDVTSVEVIDVTGVVTVN